MDKRQGEDETGDRQEMGGRDMKRETGDGRQRIRDREAQQETGHRDRTQETGTGNRTRQVKPGQGRLRRRQISRKHRSRLLSRSLSVSVSSLEDNVEHS